MAFKIIYYPTSKYTVLNTVRQTVNYRKCVDTNEQLWKLHDINTHKQQRLHITIVSVIICRRYSDNGREIRSGRD